MSETIQNPAFGFIGNALKSNAADHIVAVAEDLYDTELGMYQSEINKAAKNALGQTIQAVDGRVTDLSGVTKTVKATADSAVQTASVDCGASVEKEGTELKFSFAELIIDCGDF